MRTLSPVRSVSPVTKPRIVFNYQNSPLREKPQNDQKKLAMHYIPNTPEHRSGENAINISNLQPTTTNTTVNRQQKQTCFQCGKNATYQIKSNSIKCCFLCATNQMKIGHQVIKLDLPKYQLQDHIPFTIQKNYLHKNIEADKNKNMEAEKNGGQKNHFKNQLQNIKITNFQEESSQVSKHKQKQEFSIFVEEIENEEKQLKKMVILLEEESYSQNSIKQFYKEKKMQLKKHYQKIKQTIKMSIEKDLQELNRKEKEKLMEISVKKQDVIEDVKKINLIKGELLPIKKYIDENGEENESEIKEFFEKWKQNGKYLKNNGFFSDVSLSSIERNSQENIHPLKVNHEDTFIREKNYLYQPELYMLADTKVKRKSQVIFSFQQK